MATVRALKTWCEFFVPLGMDQEFFSERKMLGPVLESSRRSRVPSVGIPCCFVAWLAALRSFGANTQWKTMATRHQNVNARMQSQARSIMQAVCIRSLPFSSPPADWLLVLVIFFWRPVCEASLVSVQHAMHDSPNDTHDSTTRNGHDQIKVSMQMLDVLVHSPAKYFMVIPVPSFCVLLAV